MAKRFVRDEQEPSFQIRPAFDKKFRPGAVKDAIHTVLNESLGGKVYEHDKVPDWCKDISNLIKMKIKSLGYDRYKVKQNYIVYACLKKTSTGVI
jgi:hypothetical protein